MFQTLISYLMNFLSMTWSVARLMYNCTISRAGGALIPLQIAYCFLSVPEGLIALISGHLVAYMASLGTFLVS